jgi:Cu(I)/Ag(I) efflux system membrane fusion protein
MTNEQETKKDPFSLPPPTKKMKTLSMFIFFLLGLALGAFLFLNPFEISFLPSGSEKQAHEEGSKPVDTGETTQLWSCPMHPEVVEREPGLCPICHMKLVLLDRPEESPRGKEVKDQAVKLWSCPMHPEVVEKEPGLCPICHMKLVLLKQADSPAPETQAKTERRILYWQAPMDSSFVSDQPGKSPMGMDLVPVYADESGGGVSEEGAVKINPSIVQQIGVRTEAVRLGKLRPVIRTVGILDYNERDISLVNIKFDGWIEKVYVNYIGEKVIKGQKLFSIYSPELVSTQEEYIAALNYLKELEGGGNKDAVNSARALVRATRKRLTYWDITEGQIRRLERTREGMKSLTVVSPAAGVVIQKMDAALEGMYVKAGMNLYKIADLSTVWVHADVYESDIPWVKPGLKAEVSLPSFPGEEFYGKILFVQPFLTEKTRTVKACIEIKNVDRRLDPGMYAEVKIYPVASQRAVLVPEDAVIRTGERNVVFVDLGDGRFLPKDLELGLKGEGVFEVKKGLEAGEKVVVSAQFLLDSESRLQEFIRKLMAESRDDKP